jgi:sn-glycerol 3-phosphate transport system ATP-binding protein
MNLLRLADGPRGAVVHGTDGPAVLARSGDGWLLGVRPEDVRLVESNGLPARVTTVEYFGADSIVTCAVGTESMAVRAPGRVELAEGKPVQLAWWATAQHVFDATTGARVAE